MGNQWLNIHKISFEANGQYKTEDFGIIISDDEKSLKAISKDDLKGY